MMSPSCVVAVGEQFASLDDVPDSNPLLVVLVLLARRSEGEPEGVMFLTLGHGEDGGEAVRGGLDDAGAFEGPGAVEFAGFLSLVPGRLAFSSGRVPAGRALFLWDLRLLRRHHRWGFPQWVLLSCRSPARG